MTRRLAALAAASAFLLVIVWLTLTPQTPAEVPPRQWCFLCQTFGGIDFLLNILLFVPFGFLLGVAGVRAIRAMALVLAITVLIEAGQYLLLTGRVASTGDIVANFVGGGVGLVISRRWRTLLLPDVRESLVLSLAAAAGALAVLVISAWLFGPAVPGDALWGQRAPDLGQFDRFDGRVVSGSIGSISVPAGRFEDQAAIHRELGRHRLEVSASVIPGSLTEELAPIISIFDGAHREVLVLGQEGTSLAFRVRRRSALIGLRSPTITVWGVFPGPRQLESAGKIDLGGGIDAYRISAWASVGKNHLHRELEFRPTMGWAYILPFDNAWTPAVRRFTLCWMLVILLPLGYSVRWLARDRPLAAVILVGATLASALVALPAILHVGPSKHWEWIGAVAGIALGAIMSESIRLLSRSRKQPPAG